jgi:hypothetical protein
MTANQPKPPPDLAAEGKRLWRAIVADAAGQGLELDARELAWLRTAGKLADRVAALEAELVGADIVVGHAGQPVANPLLAEIRMHSALLAQTLARLRVDLVETATVAWCRVTVTAPRPWRVGIRRGVDSGASGGAQQRPARSVDRPP